MDGRVSPCDQWLDKATAGIRFGPDRRAVSEELAALSSRWAASGGSSRT